MITIELRKVIVATLKTVHSSVYYMRVPEHATFPYLVYELPNSIDSGHMEQFVLEVDGWSMSGDTTSLETLMDDVDKQLHRKTIIVNNEGSITFYRENRLPIRDDDERIIRIKYMYQVRTHKNGVN